MKKAISIALVSVMLLFSSCAGDKKNVTSDKAVEIVLKKLDDKSKETIINPDNPKVEEVILTKDSSRGYFEGKDGFKEKRVYKITFNTIHDGLLGPMVFYVDIENGDLIGTDFRS